MNREDAARQAFELGDITISKDVHAKTSVEMHSSVGDRIKSAIFGAMDGIVTTFAIVASSTGGGFSPSVILILGISNVIADGMSMGIGDAISSQAETDYILKERAREVWEFESNKEGELGEMYDLYEKRGMTRADAIDTVNVMSKYKDFFIDSMMTEELGLQVPDPKDNVWVDGGVTLVSFILFGLVPLLGYLIAAAAKIPATTGAENDLFYISIAITAVALFVLGALKKRFSIRPWWYTGTEMLILGLFCALVSWLVGLGLSQIAR